MTQPKAFWLFAIFAVLVFAMGGGSRFDIESVGPLRALAAIFLAIGLWYQTGGQMRSIAVPFALLVALGIWMAVQLVPLPPEYWRSLAGRADIVAAQDMLGMDDHWRPITFSPLRTLNSLSSLVVPLAALVLLSLLDRESLRRLRFGVIGVGIVSALLGLAQTLSNADGLFFYDITNEGSAVGLFSNRNHNALFLNIALIFALFWSPEKKRKGVDEMLIWIITARLVLVVGILLNASRFGLITLGIVGFVFALRIVLDMRRSRQAVPLWQKMAGSAAMLGGGALVVLFALLGRIPALERFNGLFEGGLSDGQRTDTLPTILQLAGDHFPYGVGFGAFEQAFRTVEPVEMLRPRYLNHAHNDWLQVVVEGGLIGVAVFAVGAIWLLVSAWRNLRARRDTDESISGVLLGLLTLGLMALHSVLDYPLRTPSIMLLAMFAIVLATRKAAAEPR